MRKKAAGSARRRLCSRNGDLSLAKTPFFVSHPIVLSGKARFAASPCRRKMPQYMDIAISGNWSMLIILGSPCFPLGWNGSLFLFKGKEVSDYCKENPMDFRRQVQVIFQDPYGSLNPRMTVEKIIADPMVVHKIHNTKEAVHKRVLELMKLVGLKPEMGSRFPHQFSGGERQRIGIARALALNPSFIICDEAVSALDVSIQAQIVNLFSDLQKKLKLTYLFISHDLAVVRHISNRIAVMYLGHIVEITSKDELFEHAEHPYTKALLSAIPVPDPDMKTMQAEIQGDVPSPRHPPTGCCFHTRCPFATEECSSVVPELKEISPEHFVACHKVHKR